MVAKDVVQTMLVLKVALVKREVWYAFASWRMVKKRRRMVSERSAAVGSRKSVAQDAVANGSNRSSFSDDRDARTLNHAALHIAPYRLQSEQPRRQQQSGGSYARVTQAVGYFTIVHIVCRYSPTVEMSFT